MGNCFSDPSKSGGQRLGSATTTPAATPAGSTTHAPNKKARTNVPPQALGGSSGDTSNDPRAAALAAAEARQQAASKKGVSAANPKAGQLSAKLEAQRRSPTQQTNNERMMDAGQWN